MYEFKQYAETLKTTFIDHCTAFDEMTAKFCPRTREEIICRLAEAAGAGELDRNDPVQDTLCWVLGMER